MQSLGYNYRLTDIQSALGISQMTKLDRLMAKRRELAAIYDKELAKLPYVEILQTETRHLSGNHLYTVKIDYNKLGITRNKAFELCKAKGVHLHVHYIPVFLQPFYKNVEGIEMAHNCTHTLDYYEKATTLPLHPSLTETNIRYVIKLLSDLSQV
jgi:dTDP-4-amino-4,6-dideoxygalactose transaminase